MTLQSNYVDYATPQFHKLSPDQMARIHHASLEILDRTGACLYDQEALDLLAKAGVRADEGNRVRIPPGLVEWALEDWYPRLLDRRNHDRWSADGGKTFRQRARARVEQILASHQPEPLPADVQTRIDTIVVDGNV